MNLNRKFLLRFVFTERFFQIFEGGHSFLSMKILERGIMYEICFAILLSRNKFYFVKQQIVKKLEGRLGFLNGHRVSGAPKQLSVFYQFVFFNN